MSKVGLKTRSEVQYDRPLVVASYFGFEPIEAPRITPVDLDLTKDCLDHNHFDAAERMAFIREYVSENWAARSHPLALAYKRSAHKKKPAGYTLHFVGHLGGITESVLIRTALSILSEEGFGNLSLELNCIGDKESINTYEKELSNQVRKFVDLPDQEIRELLRREPFQLFHREEESLRHLRESVPPSIGFLSQHTRNYFKEVLEFVEALGVEFRLEPTLVGDRHHSSHTLFNIKCSPEEGGQTLATGYSYSRLTRRLGMKKEIPMAAVSIFQGEGTTKVYKDLPKPKFYLVHLGREAKMRALPLIELLRRERIPVYHFLGRDKITAQLAAAEALAVSHLLILGQKEALDHTVTVRNNTTRAQDTVPMDRISAFLKNLPI